MSLTTSLWLRGNYSVRQKNKSYGVNRGRQSITKKKKKKIKKIFQCLFRFFFCGTGVFCCTSGACFFISKECFKNASDISTIAVSVVPVCATNHFRLSVACSDRRKAFDNLGMFPVYHNVLRFAIRRLTTLYEEVAYFILVMLPCNFVGERQALAFFVCF